LVLFVYLSRFKHNFICMLPVWLSGIVKEHEKTFDENNIRDFIDAFIVEKRKGKDNSFEVITLSSQKLVSCKLARNN